MKTKELAITVAIRVGQLIGNGIRRDDIDEVIVIMKKGRTYNLKWTEKNTFELSINDENEHLYDNYVIAEYSMTHMPLHVIAQAIAETIQCMEDSYRTNK